MKLTISIVDMEATLDIENRDCGILLDTAATDGLAFLTPSEARQVAEALRAAADEQEKRNG